MRNVFQQKSGRMLSLVAAVLGLSSCTGEVRTADGPGAPTPPFDGSALAAAPAAHDQGENGPDSATATDASAGSTSDATIDSADRATTPAVAADATADVVSGDSSNAPTGDAAVADVAEDTSPPADAADGSVQAPPPGCIEQEPIACVEGRTEWSCTPGESPPILGLCILSQADAGDSGRDAFCCIPPISGGCVLDDTLTECTGQYVGYLCEMGTDPASLDSALTCSGGVPDPDGVHVDFCCQ